jgi:hypothetical protein
MPPHYYKFVGNEFGRFKDGLWIGYRSAFRKEAVPEDLGEYICKAETYTTRRPQKSDRNPRPLLTFQPVNATLCTPDEIRELLEPYLNLESP